MSCSHFFLNLIFIWLRLCIANVMVFWIKFNESRFFTIFSFLFLLPYSNPPFKKCYLLGNLRATNFCILNENGMLGSESVGKKIKYLKYKHTLLWMKINLVLIKFGLADIIVIYLAIFFFFCETGTTWLWMVTVNLMLHKMFTAWKCFINLKIFTVNWYKNEKNRTIISNYGMYYSLTTYYLPFSIMKML